MDHDRFDELTRALATVTSRRHALKTLAGGAAGGLLTFLGVGEAAADPPGCKRDGKKCKRHTQCCSGNCASGTCAPACPSLPACNDTCPCPSGETCVADQCCPSSQVCGNICCSAGETCDSSTHTCAEPPLTQTHFHCNCEGSPDVFTCNSTECTLDNFIAVCTELCANNGGVLVGGACLNNAC